MDSAGYPDAPPRLTRDPHYNSFITPTAGPATGGVRRCLSFEMVEDSPPSSQILPLTQTPPRTPSPTLISRLDYESYIQPQLEIIIQVVKSMQDEQREFMEDYERFEAGVQTSLVDIWKLLNYSV